MNTLLKHLDILPLIHKRSLQVTDQSSPTSDQPTKPKAEEQEQNLNKEELRLLVKILKAIGHTCEHQHIRIQDGITHYQFNGTTLVFDDVNKTDQDRIMHLSPLSLMLKDPNQKRPTWEKLKALKK